jgi:hypothetical protein
MEPLSQTHYGCQQDKKGGAFMKACWTSVVLGVLLALSACAPQAPTVAADPSLANAATSLQRPPSDRARVYIFSGTAWGGYPLTLRRHQMAADIYVDGQKIGSLNGGEVIVFDLVPGKHSLWWTMLDRPTVLFGKSPHLEKVLNGGQVLFLTNDVRDFDYQLTVIPGTDYVEGGQINPKLKLKVTRPANCPPTICVQS